MTRQAHPCDAPPAKLWELVARPELWSRWSPYVRGAEGLGSPEVKEGARGEVILRGGIRVPAEITRVDPGHSWSWKVGGIEVEHTVEAAGEGSRLSMPVHARSAPWTPAAIAYAPVVGLIARRIVRVAEQHETSVEAG